MSYIHCYDDNYYRPSDNLRELLKFQIIQPFRDKLPHVAKLYDTRDFTELEYLSEKILAQGGADFNVLSTDEKYGSFTPENKVLFYCANYMAMHLYSSFHIYSRYLMQQIVLFKSKNIIFIDYGCGPLTSGIALWNAARQHNITYIGIDISQNMLNKASEINKYNPVGDSNPYFNNIFLKQYYEEVPDLLSVIEKLNPSDTVIIFNFCYVLAPETFKGNINSFINVFHQVVQASVNYKFCIVYQNPGPSYFSENWDKLSTDVIDYYFPIQRLSIQNDTVIINYQRLMNETIHRNHNVRYSIIYNW